MRPNAINRVLPVTREAWALAIERLHTKLTQALKYFPHGPMRNGLIMVTLIYCVAAPATVKYHILGAPMSKIETMLKACSILHRSQESLIKLNRKI